MLNSGKRLGDNGKQT